MSLVRAASVLVRGLLFLSCVFAVWVISPLMPSDGLDPSWRHGINEAVARGLAFGRDIVFTFGPYGSLYTGVFHPATDRQTLLASLGLGMAFGWAALRVLQSAHWLEVLAVAGVVSGLIFLRDPLFFCYPLMVGWVCRTLHAQPVPPVSPSTAWRPVHGDLELTLLFVPFGLLMLIKGSSLAQCALITLASAALFAQSRQWLRMAVVLLAPSVSLMVLWLLAGQDLSSLPAYLSTMSIVTAGYSEAMASPGPNTEIRLYLLTAVCVVAAVVLRKPQAPWHRVHAACVLGVTLLVAFKAGFVRHDGHATIASVTILLCALLLWSTSRSRWALFGLVLALITWWRIDQHHMHSTPASVLQTVRTTWTEPFVGSLRRWQSPQHLQDAYQAALQQVGVTRPLPVLPGTVDIYSFDQTQLLASGNRWNPRPVFQSYQAYTPELAQLNRAHLASVHAPDHLFFRIEPIDNRLPSTEDGPSWPLLLTRYVAHRLDASTLVLKLTPDRGESLTSVVRSEARHRIGEDIPLPASSPRMMVELDIRQTWRGRLLSTLYKPSRLFITLTLADGSRRSFRFVSGMARSGFLLSPLVETVDDFMALSESKGVPDARRVTHFSLAPASGSWQWERSVGVRFVELSDRQTGP